MGSVLVTGGAGYIGSHCVRVLEERGYSVVVLDNLSTGFEPFVGKTPFVRADILDRETVASVLREYAVETVMHFAASAYVGESVTHPEAYYRNNVVGTLSLLSAMRDAGVGQLVFSSTCAVYGAPEVIPITESLPLLPVNPYGFTKRVVERMLADFSAAYGLRYVSLRYFNAAGAHPSGEIGECHEPETHLIPLVLQAALGKRSAIQIFGTDYDTSDGTCIRDYIHILDIADAHLLALDYLMAGGVSDVFNLGNGKGYSVREVIAVAEQVTGCQIPVTEAGRRRGDPPVLVACADKARARLGWHPVYDELLPVIETAWAWESSSRKQTILAGIGP